MSPENLHTEAIILLKQLINIQSFSKEENETADLIASYLETKGLQVFRKGNNVWVKSDNFDKSKPTILLNSHHDTVKPVEGWTLDPFSPIEKDGKLFGLGSNDAGGALVSLMATFISLNKTERNYNLIYAATAEEEISGANGIASILDELGKIDLGIVGEPTLMEMAIAEKGLMVLDCEAKGIAGHAAREEGENAIYKAIKDIEWFRTFKFPKKSQELGEIKMSVTQINAGRQHNVVPDSCSFVVDVRTTEKYTNEELFDIINKHTGCEVKARSFRLNSSGIPKDHPIVKKGIELGMKTYGSPTMSDQALMPFTTIKIGPGDSARSHTANEFIYTQEIKKGIDIYVSLLTGLLI